MVVKYIYLIWVFAILTCNIAKAQFEIQLEDGKVICRCDPEKTELKVFRDQKAIFGTELYGKYNRDSASITFIPYVPFMLSGNYMAICGSKMRIFSIPVPEDYVYAQLTTIYPTAYELPENLLKFNIHFSQPMLSIAYEWINLLDADGKEIDRALMKDIPELWNEDRTELTVWIEPGRIKRGLGPNEELGPVLEAGKKYTLSVSSEIRDRAGVKLNSVMSKAFLAVEADRKRPYIDDWKVETIRLGKKTGVKISFGEVMDVGSTSYGFEIPGVEGIWSMLEGETAIILEPSQIMPPGEYQIQIFPKIEDLAGNNLLRLFDKNLKEEKEEGLTEFVKIFRVH